MPSVHLQTVRSGGLGVMQKAWMALLESRYAFLVVPVYGGGLLCRRLFWLGCRLTH